MAYEDFGLSNQLTGDVTVEVSKARYKMILGDRRLIAQGTLYDGQGEIAALIEIEYRGIFQHTVLILLPDGTLCEFDLESNDAWSLVSPKGKPEYWRTVKQSTKRYSAVLSVVVSYQDYVETKAVQTFVNQLDRCTA
jgi:hypothetical protein